MITLPSLNNLPSKWDEIRHWLETQVFECEVMPYPNLTEHEAKQFEQDFIDRIGCTPEEYVRIRRAIRLLEARYPDSSNELTSAAIATPLGEMLAVFGGKGLCLLEFVGQKHMEQEITAVQKSFARTVCVSGRRASATSAAGIGLILQMPSENLFHAFGADWYRVSKAGMGCALGDSLRRNA